MLLYWLVVVVVGQPVVERKYSELPTAGAAMFMLVVGRSPSRRSGPSFRYADAARSRCAAWE
jgi:hypothetical protein